MKREEVDETPPIESAPLSEDENIQELIKDEDFAVYRTFKKKEDNIFAINKTIGDKIMKTNIRGATFWSHFKDNRCQKVAVA